LGIHISLMFKKLNKQLWKTPHSMNPSPQESQRWLRRAHPRRAQTHTWGASRRAPANTGKSQELQAHLSYWRSQLSGSLQELQLPLLPGSPSADEKPAGRSEALWPLRSLVLPKSLREALQALAQQEGASLFEMLN
jgi:hypothetical protein